MFPWTVLNILIMKQFRMVLKFFSSAVIFVSWQMGVLLFHAVIANVIVISEDRMNIKVKW